MRNICCFLLALAILSCSRPDVAGFGSTRWGHIDPYVDSLTLVLEQAFYDVIPDDSVAVLIDRILPDGSDIRSSDGRERLARWHYWNGRLLRSREMNDSAIWHFNRAASVVDSTVNYYTWRRISTMLNSTGHSMGEWHLRQLLDDQDYYSDIGDDVMVASVSIVIAHALSDSYQPDSAIEYFHRADSIFTRLGLTKYAVKNKINVAGCLNSMGRVRECVGLVDSLLKDSVVINDFFTYNILLRNAYLYKKDVSCLHKAHDRLMELDPALPANGVIEYLLSEHYRTGVRPDSSLADHYAEMAYGRLPQETDPEIRAGICFAKAMQLERAGNTDSAYIMLKRHMVESDTVNSRRQPVQVARIRNMEVLARSEYERNEARHFYVVRILVLILVLLLVTGVAAFMLLRTRERHKRDANRLQMEKMRSELDIERYQKQILAISLSMEATDRNLAEISDKIHELRDAGKVSAEEMRHIDAVIRSHASNRDDLRQFIDLFEKAHPHFLSNLRERYPDLSDSQTKLAIYVYVGMSNKQIASYLNIRAESVKQARWRLRVKMGLGTDDSLEDALRSLAN